MHPPGVDERVSQQFVFWGIRTGRGVEQLLSQVGDPLGTESVPRGIGSVEGEGGDAKRLRLLRAFRGTRDDPVDRIRAAPLFEGLRVSSSQSE